MNTTKCFLDPSDSHQFEPSCQNKMHAPIHQTRAYTNDPNDTPHSRHTVRMHATCTSAPAFCSIVLEYKGLVTSSPRFSFILPRSVEQDCSWPLVRQLIEHFLSGVKHPQRGFLAGIPLGLCLAILFDIWTLVQQLIEQKLPSGVGRAALFLLHRCLHQPWNWRVGILLERCDRSSHRAWSLR